MSELSREECNKKFEAITRNSLDSQREIFLLRYVFQLEKEGVKEVMLLSDQFKEFVYKYKQGANAIPLNSTLFSKFLTTQGAQWTQWERKLKLQDFDLDANGEICLIEYLMFRYKPMILTQYFLREGYPVESITSQITEASGVITDNEYGIQINVGDAMKREMFQPPFGYDKVLDGGLLEFRRIVTPRQAEMKELENLIADSNTNKVDRIRAENELKKIHDEFDQPLRNTLIKFDAAIKKVQLQQEKKLKEIKSEIEFEILQNHKNQVHGNVKNLRDMFHHPPTV